MSAIRTISRTALGGGLTLARLPLDGVLRIAGDRGPATAMKLAVDRADATVRNLVGIALGDEQLMDDADRRRTAAYERERAVRLKVEANEHRQRAEVRVETRREEAEQRRGRVAKAAERRRESAEDRRNEKKSRAAKKADRRRQATRNDTARAVERVEEKATRARLEHLETKAEALEEKDAALAAADESRRLADAAARVKADRKARNGS